ncbi:MAG: hypothetical protein LBN32_01375 [Helicobacteraceae bacterium]|jgi:hypothetical protein|nr:hypothetical protein [Helicobacteraceae bacterium]
MQGFNINILVGAIVCLSATALNAVDLPETTKYEYAKGDLSVSAEAYFLTTSGVNINVHYFPLEWLYIKGAIGQESLSLDYLDSSVKYDYTQISLGVPFVEVYYRMPMNEEISGFYENSVDPYIGVNFSYELFINNNFTISAAFGIFGQPKMTPMYDYEDEESSFGLTIGVGVAYFFR